MPRATTAACEVLPPRLVRIALRREEAVDVLGLGLLAHEHHASRRACRAAPAVSASNTMLPDAAPGDAGRPCASDLAACAGSSVGTSSCSSRIALIRVSARSFVISPSGDHPDRRRHHRARVHLAVAGLQAVEPAALDRELEVLHLLVVGLELVAQLDELPVEPGHLLRHRGDRLRRADAGDDVLALRVHQVLAVDDVLAGGRIAREADAGRRVVAHVAEHHRADVDRRSVGHRRRDPELPPVIDGALAVPRLEDRLGSRARAARTGRRAGSRPCARGRRSRNASASSCSASAVSSTSCTAPCLRLIAAIAASNASSGTPIAILPNSWTKRRYASQAKRGLPVCRDQALRASPR